MGANDPTTITIDANEMVYTEKHGIEKRTITAAQTFVLALAAGGAGTKYNVTSGTLLCTDGSTLEIEQDPVFTEFTAASDGVAYTKFPGTITFRDPSTGARDIWDFRSVTVDDLDEPTALSWTIERRGDPKITMVLDTVTASQ